MASVSGSGLAGFSLTFLGCDCDPSMQRTLMVGSFASTLGVSAAGVSSGTGLI